MVSFCEQHPFVEWQSVKKVCKEVSNKLEITKWKCGLNVLVTVIFHIPSTEHFKWSVRPSIMLESIEILWRTLYQIISVPEKVMYPRKQ